MSRTDRSRTLAYATCPRLRWWQYHWGGTGIVPVGMAAPLAVGAAFHAGAQVLLNCLKAGVAPDEDAAVVAAVATLEEMYAGREDESASRELRAEQPLLVEAMVRVYARRGVQLLLDRYEVLEVEEEDEAELAGGLIWMSRADGLLRSREDGQLYVLSFKTAKSWSPRHRDDGNFDMQGLSEAWALQQRFAQWAQMLRAQTDSPEYPPSWFRTVYDPDCLPVVAGTQMVYAVKGDTKMHRQLGVSFHNTALLWPWFKQGRYAHSYFFSDLDTGANRALGSTWSQIPIYERMSIKEWVDVLESGVVQPEAGDAFDSLVFQPEPYMRQQQHIARWAIETGKREDYIADSLEDMSVYPEQRDAILAETFWHNTKSCVWPSRCPYIPLCHYGAEAEDMVASGAFVPRQPHHEGEMMDE